MRRHRFRGLAATAVLIGAAGADAGRATAAACEGGCPPPVLAEPEPALRRAVHLVWSDVNAPLASRYEIERHALGAPDPWQAVAGVPADRALHLDDAGADGNGLAPGGYEYRVRGLYRVGSRDAWSVWSPPQTVQILEACTDAGGELAGLPHVVADDRNGDGRYTGDDIVSALHACSALGGCVLEVLPVTYDDVAIVIYDGQAAACSPQKTACLTDPFPKGLAIEGHGRSTVLRSPLWRSPYLP